MLTMHGTDLSGRVLSGRYRLGRPLAAGASGRTYVAHDLRLDRSVAVKVLHEGLASDPGFLERFRAEARVVASLNHPHIVTLHDWGEDPVPYMVFELLSGGSLAGITAAGHRLTPAQAALVGSQVLAALGHAHERGLVHRDIKPGNLLFDDRGNVRVADFGLARALAESSMTEPVGGATVVGTARYAAPEQMTGDGIGESSDLYSLALVLVEAVTGELPFATESPLATLTARANAPLEAPVDMGPLGVVVERAGLPYPVERYRDATTMAEGLATAAAMLPEAEPLPLAGLEVDLDEPEPTEVAPLTVEAPRPPVPEPTVATEPVEDAVAPSRERRRILPWVVTALAAAAVAAAAVAVGGAMRPVVHAPNLIGASEESAEAAADAAGVDLAVVQRLTAADPAGTVIRQSPDAGETLREGSDVSVVVSAGPPPVDLPDLVAKPLDAAVRALDAAGFDVDVKRRFDDVKEGIVVSQDPVADRAPRGSTVTLVVSRGPEPVPVPNVVGQAADDAAGVLEEAGFEVERAEDFSDQVEKGDVIRQDPVTGAEAVPGTVVTVVVSKGPDRIAIPDVRGMTIDEATGDLESSGFEVDVIGYSPGSLVKRMDPAPRLMLERGRTVTLFF